MFDYISNWRSNDKNRAVLPLTCTAVMRHVPVRLSLLVSCVSVCVAVFMIPAVHVPDKSLNEFPECVRARQSCLFIRGESTADERDVGKNKRAGLPNQNPITICLIPAGLLDKQTDRSLSYLTLE